MPTIGDVSTISMVKSHRVEWKILNFTSLTKRKYSSPPFSFAGECWILVMCPNGSQSVNSALRISLFLVKKSCGPFVLLNFSLGLKTLTGRKFVQRYHYNKFEKRNNAMGNEQFISRSDLFGSGAITVFCNLKYPKTGVNTSKSYVW